MTEFKRSLIKIFQEKVKNKVPDVADKNVKHDGKYGNWLEEQFGKSPDADNHADFWGYELKNETSSKTTFGDWSANIYIFKDKGFKHLFDGETTSEKQDSFCRIFGTPNPKKNNRCSWSGAVVPKINKYNAYGQKLVVDENSDIIAYYSFSQDERENKDLIVPTEFQRDNLVLAKWFGKTSPTDKQEDKCLKEKLEDKFNVNGWFTCKKDAEGKYSKICFGEPIDFDTWIDLVNKGIVFLDSGMYETNRRPYSQWRASNEFWNSLITDEYE